jgi:hypothetical protein
MEVSGQRHDPLLVPIGLEAGWVPEPVWVLWSKENLAESCVIEIKSKGLLNDYD